MKDLYAELKEIGVELDHHESDLYVKSTPESRKIIREKEEWGYTMFRSPIDGSLWFAFPFRWTPYWEDVARKSKLKGERT